MPAHEAGELLRGEPVEVLAHRLGIDVEFIGAAFRAQTESECDQTESLRLFMAGVAPVARTAGGRYLCAFEDAPIAHAVLVLHRRGEVEACAGAALGDLAGDLEQLVAEVRLGLLPLACIPRALRQAVADAAGAGASPAEGGAAAHTADGDDRRGPSTAP